MEKNESNIIQKEIEVIHVDEKLHATILKKFLGLISLDVISFFVFSVVLGVFTFARGFHIVPGIFFAICVIGLLWNLKSLIAVMMKKYECYNVMVDKVWEENGTRLCCITPDAYESYDFTTEITIRNYTKKYSEVKEGDKVIVVAGKFSRYIYIFDYDSAVRAEGKKNITVDKNPLNAKKKTKDKIKQSIHEENLEGIGTVYFKTQKTDDGIIYNHIEGLDESMYGPHMVISVARCSIPEDRLEDAIAAIEATYRNSNLILEGFYDMAVRTIRSDKTIQSGYENIDKTYIKENFVIEELDLSIYDKAQHGRDDVEISLYGKVEAETGEWLLDGKAFLIHINCMSGEVNFELKDF